MKEPKKSLSFKQLLLFQPAIDPPSATLAIGRGNPVISSMSPHEFGVLVATDSGRQYVVPWSNIRHAELEA